MADLSSAESAYASGNYPQAIQRAQRAQRGLKQGTADWQRAADIVSIATSEMKQQQRR
jgi:predicted Zn-dependent protease